MAAKTEVSQDVGRRLRDVREARGIPKERVALEMEMSAENWRHYESGRNQLAVTQLPKLADIFRMTLPELVAALFDAREICNTQYNSDNGRSNPGNANYNYTESRGRAFGPAQWHRPMLAAASNR